MALRLRKICDSDSKFKKRTAEKQKHLIARDYKPSKVEKQFSNARNISREQARRPKTKTNFILLHNAIQCFLTLNLFSKNSYLCYTATKK